MKPIHKSSHPRRDQGVVKQEMLPRQRDSSSLHELSSQFDNIFSSFEKNEIEKYILPCKIVAQEMHQELENGGSIANLSPREFGLEFKKRTLYRVGGATKVSHEWSTDPGKAPCILTQWYGDPQPSASDIFRLQEIIDIFAKILENRISQILATGSRQKHPELLLPVALLGHEYISTQNSSVYHELQKVIAAAKDSFSIQNGDPFHSAKISNRSVNALVRLAPDDKSIHKFTDAELHECQKRMSDLLKGMDDETADCFDIISAIWLKQANHPESMATIKADDFLRYRALKPQKSGSGRRGGYKSKSRQDIADHISRLENLWITVIDTKAPELASESGKSSRNKMTKWQASGRVILVESVLEKKSGKEQGVYAWRVRPGLVFAPYLLGPGRQIALLSQQALKYDPKRQIWEKRLTRYFSWLWRNRGSSASYSTPVKVDTVLKGIKESIDNLNPIRTKDRLEKALERLRSDNVIAGWEYSEANEEVVGKKGWVNLWLDWKLIVEPPQLVMDHYQEINRPLHSHKTKNPPSNHKINSIEVNAKYSSVKEFRQKLGITQMQAAEQIGIACSSLSRIERGIITASSDESKRISLWKSKNS